ncbi:MAG TPA: 3'-5' exonuclease [Dissulfurispiraceae bacterium]|nr:3'-5' exonuclease [Dissulfurispiraceae bacterium]
MRIYRSTDLKAAKFYAIDIETTGLDYDEDEIISFACVPIINLKILVRDTFYTLIKPKRYNYKAMRYHGISKDNLMDAPVFEEVSDRILKMLDGILVGHSVEFDLTFLKNNFKSLGVRFKRDIIDIAMVERWLTLKQKTEENNFTLDGIIATYGLKKYYRHNAAADAFFAAQIFQLQMREMMALGIDSVKKIIKAAKSCGHSEPGIAF